MTFWSYTSGTIYSNLKRWGTYNKILHTVIRRSWLRLNLQDILPGRPALQAVTDTDMPRDWLSEGLADRGTG
jgi:hypothetical protein